MNLKYLIYFLLTAFSVTASNIEDIKTWSRIKDPLRHLEQAYSFQTSRYTTTEKRRYLLSAMISEKSNYFRWNSFQDMALLVEDLMAIGADLNMYDSDPERLILVAARRGDLEVVTMLLDNGVDVNTTNSNGKTALLASFFHAHRKIAYLLLERGADLLLGDALQYATRHGFIPDRITPFIRKIEPDSKLANELGNIFVEDALYGSVPRYLNLSRPYIDACLDNITNKDRLHEWFLIAIKKCRVPVVQALLERGCSWVRVDLKEIFVFLKNDYCDYRWGSRKFRLSRPETYGSAMAEFIKVGMLEGATFDEMDALLDFLKTMEYKNLHAEVLNVYFKKKWENSYWICTIS